MEMLQGKSVLIVGLGKSGAGAARFCRRKGARVRVSDGSASLELEQKAIELERDGIQVELGGHDENAFVESDLIVVSPGVPLTLPELIQAGEKGVRIIGETELAAGFIDTPIVAVTGTNGKSTVTTLAGKMLEASGFKVFAGGNLGTPLIEYADSEQRADVAVVEISSFQLDAVDRFRPRVAVLLNISEDHLDRYEGFDSYAVSKLRIFGNQTPDDFAVLNQSDPFIDGLTKSVRSRKLNTGQFEREIGRWFNTPGFGRLFKNSPLPGAHNSENIAAAALASAAAGAPPEGILDGLKNFKGLPHRMQYLGEKNGIRFYDDSKATNIDAARKALESFNEPVVLIMGGRGKGYRFDSLRDTVKKRVKRLILLGETRHEIADVLGGVCKGGHCMAGSMDEAVLRALESAESGDIILLAPACASFDMFSGYAERGDKFYEAFQGL